jgi:F0F1-type ATP synthase assembly protein I
LPLSPKNLEDRIAVARDRATHGEPARPGSGPDAESYSALSFGLSAGAQFVAAVVGGGGLGWVIDRWLGTSPFGLLILMIVCFVAALVNVWLMMSKAVATVTAGIASGEISAEKQDKDTEEVDGESS